MFICIHIQLVQLNKVILVQVVQLCYIYQVENTSINSTTLLFYNLKDLIWYLVSKINQMDKVIGV